MHRCRGRRWGPGNEYTMQILKDDNRKKNFSELISADRDSTEVRRSALLMQRMPVMCELVKRIRVDECGVDFLQIEKLPGRDGVFKWEI